jgi:glycosyltransferase involved in cell wall biosynthesis
MRKVFVRAPVLSRSGYGEHARLIVDALASRSDLFDLYVEAIPWGATPWITDTDHKRKYYDFLVQKRQQYNGPFDISVQVTIPPEFKKYAPINVGITAGIESDRVHPNWIGQASAMDMMIFTSKHAHNGFLRNDVKHKLPNGQVVPFKYDTLSKVIGYPVKEVDVVDLADKIKLPNEYNFLTVAQWGPRKNLPNLIKWFVEEFQNEQVGLVVKANKVKNCIVDRMVCTDMIKQILEPFPDKKCTVHLLHGNMSTEEMHGLYTHPQIKSFVTTTHGEGYGLPLFEAAYSGMPIAAPGWSGHMDFLCMAKEGKKSRQTMFEKIGYELKPIQQEAHWEGILIPDSQWSFAKENKVKSAMRKLYKDFKVKKNTALKLREHLLVQNSQESIYKQIVDAVLEVSPEISEEWQNEVSQVGTL